MQRRLPRPGWWCARRLPRRSIWRPVADRGEKEIHEQLQRERTRILAHLLPKRSAMAGDAQTFPLAMEICLPQRRGQDAWARLSPCFTQVMESTIDGAMSGTERTGAENQIEDHCPGAGIGAGAHPPAAWIDARIEDRVVRERGRSDRPAGVEVLVTGHPPGGVRYTA